MTEYWVSKARYWCKFCQCWLADTNAARTKHDNGNRHKQSVEDWMRDNRKQKQQAKRAESDFEKEMKEIERAARAQFKSDVESGTAQFHTGIGGPSRPGMPPPRPGSGPGGGPPPPPPRPGGLQPPGPGGGPPPPPPRAGDVGAPPPPPRAGDVGAPPPPPRPPPPYGVPHHPAEIAAAAAAAGVRPPPPLARPGAPVKSEEDAKLAAELAAEGIILDTDADDIGGVSRAELEAEKGSSGEALAADGAATEEIGEGEGEAIDGEEGPPLLWWEYKPASQEGDDPVHGPYEGSHMYAWAADGYFESAFLRRVTHDGSVKFTDWIPTTGLTMHAMEKLLLGYVSGPPPDEPPPVDEATGLGGWSTVRVIDKVAEKKETDEKLAKRKQKMLFEAGKNEIDSDEEHDLSSRVHSKGAKDELFLEKVDDEPEEPFTGTVTFAKATKKAEGGGTAKKQRQLRKKRADDDDD